MFLAPLISASKPADCWLDDRQASRDLHKATQMVEEEAEMLEAEIAHLRRQLESLRAFVQGRKGSAPRSLR